MIRTLLKDKANTLYVNADQLIYNDIFSSRDLNTMQELISTKTILCIDEAQNIPNIGINLKILHDEMPELKIIVTGSSSFELANRLQEPLTGRTETYRLYPISAREIINDSSVFDLKNQIESLLIYGMYPEILLTTGSADKIDHVWQIKKALGISGVQSTIASERQHKRKSSPN